MLLYVIIMLLCSLLFGVIAIMVYQGRTDLIHDYHQQKVTDKAAYGRAFGKALLGISLAALASAAAALLIGAAVAVAVLIACMACSIGAIWRVQKKYNQGLF